MRNEKLKMRNEKVQYMKKLYIQVLLLIVAVSAHTQEITVKQFMQKAQQAYHQASRLSFQVQYRYANKNQPGNYIDSLSGAIMIDKNRVRSVIDDVETVTTANYTIRVMKDEKLIYLAKAMQSPLTDPVSLLDSALAHLNGIQAGIVRNNKQVTLNLRFPPGQAYKNITMTMDESTGYFQKVVYELYTTDLVGQEQIDKPGQPAPYQEEGIVEMIFSLYRQDAFDDSLFDEAQYFTKLGKGQYEPAEQYKDYQIFLASSGL
jgi:hypothetical protein